MHGARTKNHRMGGTNEGVHSGNRETGCIPIHRGDHAGDRTRWAEDRDPQDRAAHRSEGAQVLLGTPEARLLRRDDGAHGKRTDHHYGDRGR